jgi:multiple sugar transport system permease protein
MSSTPTATPLPRRATAPAAPDPGAAGPRSRRRRGTRGGRRALPWLLMAPSVLLVVCVTFLPIAQAIELSFHETVYLEQGTWTGLDNYQQFLGSSSGVHSIVITLVFAVASLVLTMPLALGLALLLNRPMRGRTVLRTVLIVPWVASQLLTALMWRWLLDADIGPVAYVLGLLANGPVDLLADSVGAMAAMVVANVWRTYPYAMILILAALQTVPRELHEAAKVDGASPLQRLRYITLPSIRTTMLIATIILSVNAVNMIELPLVMTGGGPADATNLLGLEVFNEAFKLNHLGFASAIAVVMFAINAVVSLAYIAVLREDRRSAR